MTVKLRLSATLANGKETVVDLKVFGVSDEEALLVATALADDIRNGRVQVDVVRTVEQVVPA
jgi:hypothetical protein